MTENEIYCYVNGFLKWNISKKTSYVIGNKKFFGKICILNFRNKRKSIFARVIIRNYRWEKIPKETGKIIIKSTYRRNNQQGFMQLIPHTGIRCEKLTLSLHFWNSIFKGKNRKFKVFKAAQSFFKLIITFLKYISRF